jgi:hypothetical protein
MAPHGPKPPQYAPQKKDFSILDTFHTFSTTPDTIRTKKIDMQILMSICKFLHQKTSGFSFSTFQYGCSISNESSRHPEHEYRIENPVRPAQPADRAPIPVARV